MKKIYVCLFVMSSIGSFAQKNTLRREVSTMDRSYVSKKQNANHNFSKLEGDIKWQNGFDLASEWTQTLGPNHTSGANNPGWEIVTALPSNITSQQASYQWPSTFSTASGNYALINSDAAGSGPKQDAYYAFNSNIDLSAAGSTPMYLTFNEYYRNFLDGTFVEVSIDGGTNWTIFEANPESEVPVNTNCTAGEKEVINITSVIGTGVWTNQVRIRFHYTGDYDWFWGIDNVKIVEAWQNDIKVNNWYASTDTLTSQGLDYFVIDDSQVNFPGLIFGAKVTNNGSLAQSSVALNATATGGYNATGTPIALAAGAIDSVSISTPYDPTGLGIKTINLSTAISAVDSDTTNNKTSLSMELSQYEYSRDNGDITGAISNVTSNTGNPLKIGNIMDIFNNWTSTGANLFIPSQQTGTAGLEYWVELYRFDGTDYVFVDETVKKTIGTTSVWSDLGWSAGPLSLSAGDDILLLACHTGGTTSIRFGMAQNTFEGSVIGYDAAGTAFSLSSPGAIMVRLTDNPAVSSIKEIEDSFGMKVYPNPASDLINVSLNKTTNATISVVDVTGKIVKSSLVNGLTTSINTVGLSNGVYYVNVTDGTSVSTQKVVIRK